MRGNRQIPGDRRAVRSEFLDLQEFADLHTILGAEFFPDAVLRKCEHLIGLVNPDTQFREGILFAVLLACFLHHAGPKRASTVRHEFKLVAKRATVAGNALQQLSEALDQTALHDKLRSTPPFDVLVAPITPKILRKFAENVTQAADRIKDGGGPGRLLAFEIFVRTLADAFGRATGHPASVTLRHDGDRDRYGGRFFRLMDYVLLMAEPLLGGDKFCPFSNVARGHKVQETLIAIDKTSQTGG